MDLYGVLKLLFRSYGKHYKQQNFTIVMILIKDEDIAKIAKDIIKIKNVKAVYLFGSYAANKQTPLSDIDLCIIGQLNAKERYKVLNYSSDNLDISFFEDLPIYIQMRVFKEGKSLVSKDEEFVRKLKFEALRRYLDFKPAIERFCRETLKCTT